MCYDAGPLVEGDLGPEGARELSWRQLADAFRQAPNPSLTCLPTLPFLHRCRRGQYRKDWQTRARQGLLEIFSLMSVEQVGSAGVYVGCALHASALRG